MLEGFDPLEIMVFIGILIYGIGYITMITLPPLFAWADRWIDRTRNTIKDVVSSKDDNE